jgi:hypothetical protein
MRLKFSIPRAAPAQSDERSSRHLSTQEPRFRHSATVYASSVLKAAATGRKQISETEMIRDDRVLDLTADLITTASHKISPASGGPGLKTTDIIRVKRYENEAEVILAGQKSTCAGLAQLDTRPDVGH